LLLTAGGESLLVTMFLATYWSCTSATDPQHCNQEGNIQKLNAKDYLEGKITVLVDN
jgi:hypothetical protein